MKKLNNIIKAEKDYEELKKWAIEWYKHFERLRISETKKPDRHNHLGLLTFYRGMQLWLEKEFNLSKEDLS